jgi:hypothetical protein
VRAPFLRIPRQFIVSNTRLTSLALALVALLLAGVVRVYAQDVTEVSLKGVFIFNFARFTEWPSESMSSSSVVSACVVGDRAVGEALKRSVSRQTLNGRTIVVSILEPNVAIPSCHFLYLSGVARPRMAEIVYNLHDAPVLTVSDDEAFLKLGGMIQVFIENGKMRFRINPKSAKRARLQLSSRLLALADLVEGDAPPPPPAVNAGATSKAR